MKGHAAFGRANALMAVIANAARVMSFTAFEAWRLALPAYKSRGKGEAKSNRSARGAVGAARRAAVKARNVKRNRRAHRG